MPKFIKVLTIKDEVLEKGYDAFGSMDDFLDYNADVLYQNCFEVKIIPGTYAKFFGHKDIMHDIIEDVDKKFSESGCGSFKGMAILIVFTQSIPDDVYDVIDVKNIRIMCEYLLSNYTEYKKSVHMELFNERIKRKDKK